MLGLTVKVVALVVAHVKVTSCPAATDVALAVKVTVGGALVTLIVTVCVALPPGPVATAVNVVFVVTATFWDPETGSELCPLVRIEGVIVTVVAFVEAQVSVTDWPELTLVESAEKVSVGEGVGSGFGDEDALPPQAVKNDTNETRPRTKTKRTSREAKVIPQMETSSLKLGFSNSEWSCSCPVEGFLNSKKVSRNGKFGVISRFC
jgi:hypothetical protein